MLLFQRLEERCEPSGSPLEPGGNFQLSQARVLHKNITKSREIIDFTAFSASVPATEYNNSLGLTQYLQLHFRDCGCNTIPFESLYVFHGVAKAVNLDTGCI